MPSSSFSQPQSGSFTHPGLSASTYSPAFAARANGLACLALADHLHMLPSRPHYKIADSVSYPRLGTYICVTLSLCSQLSLRMLVCLLLSISPLCMMHLAWRVDNQTGLPTVSNDTMKFAVLLIRLRLFYGLSQLALKPVPLQCLHDIRPCIACKAQHQ